MFAQTSGGERSAGEEENCGDGDKEDGVEDEEEDEDEDDDGEYDDFAYFTENNKQVRLRVVMLLLTSNASPMTV